MKFLCCSDLHFEEQAKEFLFSIIDREKPDCVLIAGDIANDSPSFAQELFDELEVPQAAT